MGQLLDHPCVRVAGSGDYGHPGVKDGVAGLGCTPQAEASCAVAEPLTMQEHSCYHELCRLLGKINVKLAKT